VSRKIELVRIDSPDQIPSIHKIRTYSRDIELRIIFNKPVQERRESIGEYLKKKLPGFLVSVHLVDPIIIIVKLITEEEVMVHQGFFEQCAKDYRDLAQQLIFQLAEQRNISIDPANPNNSFYQLKRTKKSSGAMEQWEYFLHGIHCGFVHKISKQAIEVSLIYGLEFGELDPYFFTQFILSTPAYQPLPVAIYEAFHDGEQINKTMLSLGKFEQIQSIFEDRFGIVVTDRKKIPVQILKPEQVYPKKKPAFSVLKFLGLKK